MKDNINKTSHTPKKKSIWDSFTYVYLGFLTICSILITVGAYNKNWFILSITFSFIAGFLVMLILSIGRTKDIG